MYIDSTVYKFICNNIINLIFKLYECACVQETDCRIPEE